MALNASTEQTSWLAEQSFPTAGTGLKLLLLWITTTNLPEAADASRPQPYNNKDIPAAADLNG